MNTDMKKTLCDAYHRLAAAVEGPYGDPLVTAKLEDGLVAVKRAGVAAANVTPEDILAVNSDNLAGADPRVAIHLALYAACDGIGAIAQTDSRWSSIWAQSGVVLPPTSFLHAAYFFGEIPCTGSVTFAPGEDMYQNAGALAVKALSRKGIHPTSAVFVRNASGVVCDPTVEGAVTRALALEEICLRAYYSGVLNEGCHSYVAIEAAEALMPR